MMVGSILVVAGFARIGFIADFFPETVIVGFINGVGLIIIFSQLGSLLGLELKQADFSRVWWIFFPIFTKPTA